MGDKVNNEEWEKTANLKIENGDRRDEYAARYGWGIRHVQVTIMLLASIVAYSLRINLSVAILAMVRYKNQTEPQLAETYEWGEDIQGYILSSFYWAYCLLQIPAGIITAKYGGHRFLSFAIIGSSALTTLMPQCAYIGGWVLVCINRIVLGVCQVFVFPSLFTLLGVWAPPLERSRFTSITLGGQLLGTVTTSPVSGYLCSLYGWPSVFYVFGTLGTVLGIVIMLLGSDYPANHRLISESEKHYIESSLGGAKVQMNAPWKHILTSAAYWATLISASFQTLVFLILLTKMPTYLATVLKFSIKDSGVLSALPYLVSYLLSFAYSWSCDLITERGCLSLTAARKVFNSLAHVGGTICIILMAYTTDPTLSVVLLTALMGCKSATYTGATANFVDLAPNFSGPIFSVANLAQASLGLVGPMMVGFIVTEPGSVPQWRIVFYICAAGLTLSNLLYIFLGTAKTQWWNWPDKYTDKNNCKEVEMKSMLERKAELRRLSLNATN